MEEKSSDAFAEYHVVVSNAEWADDKTITLSVWAKTIEDAMTCGEVLSAVYLCGE